MRTTGLLSHHHCQPQQKEALLGGDTSPDNGGEELSSVDVGGGEGACGRELANDGQDGDCHRLV